MRAKIYCPHCGRILGDSDKPLNGLRINCHSCKKTASITLKMAKNDIFYDRLKPQCEKEDKNQ